MKLAHGEPLTLDHQETLNALWKPLCLTENLQYAEYSFSNAFLFRRKHEYKFIFDLQENTPFIQGKLDPDMFGLIPTCHPSQIDLEQLKRVLCSDNCLTPIPDHWLDYFKKMHPHISSCRGESDYMYKAEKFKTFAGRELSSRRNLLHQFEANYEISSRILDNSTLSDAIQVLDEWQEGTGKESVETDYLPCIDAINYMDQLELFGRIAYADNKPVGFTIGVYLTPKTVLMHFAKSLHSVKGVTPFLYHDFALNLPDSVEWLNLEQDLCIPSLRQAKESYDPDFLLTKWRIELC